MEPFEFERAQRILGELKKYRVQEEQRIEPIYKKNDESWELYQQGTFFGKKNRHYTLKGSFSVPSEWKKATVALRIETVLGEWDNTTNPQMNVSIDGTLIQSIDVNHREIILDHFFFDRSLDLSIELWAGRTEKKFPLYVSLIKIDPEVEQMIYDLFTFLDCWRAIRQFGGKTEMYQKFVTKAVNSLDFRQPYSTLFYSSLKSARRIFEELYHSAGAIEERVTAVGHTHIDLAWLWTVQQAIEKGQRSFQTVLKLMEEFPEYTFLQSQPQMYQFIKEQAPELYDEIKRKVVEGKWEVEGAMWVEADCNLTSGESLVRQLLYGKRFIKKEFGIDSQILWLPDVFGYSAALPQLLLKTNTPYFMTTKLSWNQFNQLPYDSFYWQGIDGSRVLTHFITTISEGYSPTSYYTTYNGLLDPYTIKGSFDRYQQKSAHNEILVAYGYGDGGGGPTRQMLEVQRRLHRPLPEMPTITGNRASEFYQRLEHSLNLDDPPVWYGELYFEYHRGTLTSIGKNKKANRQSEFFLQTIEKLYSCYGLAIYPQELENLWKKLLLNQFHDILPGSSIKEVYQETDQDYQLITNNGNALIQQLTDFLAEQNKDRLPSLKGQEYLTVYNPLGIQRDVIICFAAEKQSKDAKFQQRTHDGQLLVKLPHMASLSNRIVQLVENTKKAQVVQPIQKEFETTDFIVKFNRSFEIISLYDKRYQREILPEGTILNQLIAYEDLPMNYDAWDIDIYYDKKAYFVDQLSEAKLVEKGPIRDTIKVIRPFENSAICQLIHFYHDTGRIDFETTVDWHLHHLLLKVQMPIAVNTLEATFDIQFGNVKRAVHQNTSWDLARFESCGQKWVDLSEEGFGVSILTDSKYGFNTAYQKVGISLIKAATDPYPDADQGIHKFTYSLYAHHGTWKEADTMEQALDLNVPALILPILLDCEDTAYFSVDEKNILLDTVKKAEEEEAVIVRLYEYHNRQTVGSLSAKRHIERAFLCNLLEEEEEELPVNGNCVSINFKPYEIHTIKLYME